jgi:hypothetical protein
VLAPDSETGGYLDRQDLARRLDRHQRQQTDSAYALWAAWILERWLRTTARHEVRAGVS